MQFQTLFYRVIMFFMLISSMKMIPQNHAQRFFSKTILGPVKLAVNTITASQGHWKGGLPETKLFEPLISNAVTLYCLGIPTESVFMWMNLPVCKPS